MYEYQEIIIEDEPTQDIALEDGNPVILAYLTRVIRFTKSDFVKVGDRYVFSIPKEVHKFETPFVQKIFLAQTDEEGAYMTPAVFGERVLPSGTIEVYVTVDLDSYTSYEGLIYVEGEI